MSPGPSCDSGHSPGFQTPYCKFLELFVSLMAEHQASPSLLERIDADPRDDQDLCNRHSQYDPLP